MLEFAGYGALGLTVGLVLGRPQVGARRVGPAAAIVAGLCLMGLTGLVGASEVRRTIEVAWRPLLTVASIMVMTAAAHSLGAVHQLAVAVSARVGRSAVGLFTGTFILSALLAAVLNNDATVLLLTPLVVAQVSVAYPDRPELQVPFVFTVFMAAGVAPLVVSNPMNLIVAEYAGIGFNEYFVRMAPVGLVGDAVALVVLLLIFRRDLGGDAPARPAAPPPWRADQVQILGLLGIVLLAYGVTSYAGGPIWLVAVGGAATAAWLCTWHLGLHPASLARRAIPWQILVFLAGMLTIALGLANAGIVDRLAAAYQDAGIPTVGAISAAGSAVINNHPMALVNLLGLEAANRDGVHLLAALVGGDLGPRLLPIGSLAGMMWLDIARRAGVEISLRRFVSVGFAVTVPSLIVSLATLALVTS